ncbi:MAG: type II secretion system protein [Firmicutes bacterium]|nr:type II secretion system protein [Bacillota bacterium]
MKRKTGFTLIELLAVIVILAVIALIATPLIMGTITKAKKNAFKDTAYGILKAGEKYTAEVLLESENTYEGEMIPLPEVGEKKLAYKGQEPIGGRMMITKDGDISLVIYNDSWCAIKVENDKEVKVEKYDKDTCKIAGITFAQVITNKNKDGNQEGLFTDDYTNIRYRGSDAEVKNYVLFNDELWRVIGVFDKKVKIIRNESLKSMQWHNDYQENDWYHATLNSILYREFYTPLKDEVKAQIFVETYYLGGVDARYSVYRTPKAMYQEERGKEVYKWNAVEERRWYGLMYPSDYGYAARSSCNRYLSEYYLDVNCSTEGNWLYKNEEQWAITPSSTNSTVSWISSSGSQSFQNVTYQSTVRPVTYLRPDIESIGGDGTQANPYLLGA